MLKMNFSFYPSLSNRDGSECHRSRLDQKNADPTSRPMVADVRSTYKCTERYCSDKRGLLKRMFKLDESSMNCRLSHIHLACELADVKVRLTDIGH